ncbi:MAG: OsmC family peroxiredoxin [Solirubrobacterales bacterium]
MAAESTAKTVWKGDLASGSGRTAVASGTFPEFDVSWPARTERSAGTTSPEELLAASHASCYCMALSAGLGKAGTPPERLEAEATVTFVPGEGVKSSHLVVSGVVAGIDQAGFEEAAAAAGQGCPISQALKGNVEISVEAKLAD